MRNFNGLLSLSRLLKVKKLMTEAPVTYLSNFSKMFEVTCDTSRIAIGGVLSQKNHPVAYFSEKLNDAR